MGVRKEKLMQNFQQLGKSLLLPVAILAAVGIVVGFTASLTRPQVQDLLPFMQNEGIKYVLLSIRSISLMVFGLIPVLFAISIAFGFAKKEQGIAALAGCIAYYVLLGSASLIVKSPFINYDAGALTSVLGLKTVNLGAFGGIIAGFLAAAVHNKYYDLKLPTAFAFFGGKRSVAIITIFWAALIGQGLPYIWSPISSGINQMGLAIADLGLFGTFLYGFFENLLVPTGLHHVLISIFRTTPVGGVLEVGGQVYEGTWSAFFGGFGKVPTEELRTFTKFMAQSRIPAFVFGLPGAALAMYHATANERKKIVKPLLIAGFLAIFTTGIQEPLVFLFLFIAPPLAIFHAAMCGLGAMLVDYFGVVIGNTQGGIIDLLVYGVLVPGSNWYYAVLSGMLLFASYYFVFKWYFRKHNLVIAGDLDAEMTGGSEVEVSTDEKSLAIIEGLGGMENIENAYNCMTRLRVDIKDYGKVDSKTLMGTGAVAVNKVSDKHVQVIYGTHVDVITTNVNNTLDSLKLI